MYRTPVSSSNIAAIGWEPGPVPWIGSMEVEFLRGAVYCYYGVSENVARLVIEGHINESVGRTFYVLVRKVDYPYKRIK